MVPNVIRIKLKNLIFTHAAKMIPVSAEPRIRHRRKHLPLDSARRYALLFMT